MAQAYIRQSTFADGDTITAALFNDEYNQLVNAFAYSSSSASSTGHRHDGTAGQGGNIFKIGDLDFLNKVEIDSTNNRVGFYVEVSSAAVEQLRVQDGALVPVTDSDVDLGTTSLRFKDTFTDSITTTGNVEVGGNLTVTGTTTFNGGTITMGDAATDNVVFGADVDSSIIPDDDDTYDLGSSSQQWRNIFIDGTAEIDTLSLNGTTVTSTATELNVLAGVTSTAAELNILDGVTSTAAELNILDGVTATATELNILDGVTATTAELNILDGVTSTAAELNILDGVTATAAELNILDGVTATASELNILDGVTSTATELNLLDGVTATTTELNYVDVATAGTVEASKAIVVDSNKDFTGTRNITTTGSLSAGGGSTNGVQISQGAISIKNGGAQSYIDFYCEVSNAHYARLQAPAHANFGGNITLTLPSTTGTLALTSGDITGNAATATALATARTIHGVSFDGTANIDLTEVVQDTVGAMFSSNTETGIAATYEDGDGTIDLVIGSGVITNAMLAGSIANSKLANSSNTVSDGSNSTATALGGTITFAGTSNEVEVAESSGTVTVGLPSNVTIGNNLTVTGNLTVSGTTTQTGPIVSDDNFTGLLNNNSGNSSDFGFFGKYVESSTTKYAGLYFDASTDNTFRLFTDTQTEPAATVDTSATGYAAANLVTAGITATTGTFSGAVSGTTGTFSGDLAVDTNVLKVDTSNNRIGVNQASPTVSIDAGSNTDAILVPVGTTAQRPPGAAGQFRYNSTTSQFEGYTSSWGAIAGGGGSGGSSSTFAKNTFAGDGSTTAFTLNTSMTNEDGLIVFIDGVYQADNVYSVSGTTLTFATAPVNSRVIEVFQLEGGIVGTAPSIDTMTGDGSDTTLALSTTPSSENQTFVTIDGVVQHKDTYAVSGSTLTFSTAPPTGTKVECVTFSNVAVTTFQDADNDTKIQVEESTDEDTIRMDIAGTEVLTLTNSAMTLKGTTPTLTIGDAGAEDTKIVFDGNAQDYYVGLDDSADDLIIGLGSTVGTTPAISIDESRTVMISQYLTLKTTDDAANQWYLYTNTNDNFELNYNGSGNAEVVVDTSGNVGIGTTSPSSYDFNDPAKLVAANTSGNSTISIVSGTSSYGYLAFADATSGTGRYSGYVFYNHSDDAIGFATAGAEKMRILGTAGGYANLCIGRTGYIGDASVGLHLTTGGWAIGEGTAGNTTAGSYRRAYYASGDDGLYYWNGNNQAYLTSAGVWSDASDERLKKDIVDIPYGLDTVKSLKPRKYKMKANDLEQVGFIAQEVKDIIPEVAELTAVEHSDKENEEQYGLSYGHLTAVLTKAIQEQQEQIETLTARIETLEGGE